MSTRLNSQLLGLTTKGHHQYLSLISGPTDGGHLRACILRSDFNTPIFSWNADLDSRELAEIRPHVLSYPQTCVTPSSGDICHFICPQL